MKTIKRLEDIKKQDINAGEYVLVAKPGKNFSIHWPLIFAGISRATRLRAEGVTEEFGEPFIGVIEKADNPNLIHYISYSTIDGKIDGSYSSGSIDKKHPRFNKFRKLLEEAE